MKRQDLHPVITESSIMKVALVLALSLASALAMPSEVQQKGSSYCPDGFDAWLNIPGAYFTNDASTPALVRYYYICVFVLIMNK